LYYPALYFYFALIGCEVLEWVCQFVCLSVCLGVCPLA